MPARLLFRYDLAKFTGFTLSLTHAQRTTRTYQYLEAAQVTNDKCIFRLDGECDHDLNLPSCDAGTRKNDNRSDIHYSSSRSGSMRSLLFSGTDCFDCDPCLEFDSDCAMCTAQDYCGWCSTGTGISFCLSLGFIGSLPKLCSNDGTWNYGKKCEPSSKYL